MDYLNNGKGLFSVQIDRQRGSLINERLAQPEGKKVLM